MARCTAAHLAPLLLLLRVAPLVFARELLVSVSDDTGKPIADESVHTTVPYNYTRPRGSLTLPETDPRVGQSFYDGTSPEQIRVLYYGSEEVMFSWVTGNASVYVGDIVPRDVSLESSDVQLVGVGDVDERARTYFGVVDSYSYNYWASIPGAHNYTSGAIHRVRVAGLTPGTEYQYRVGSSADGIWSNWLNFTMPGSSSTYPIRFGIVADGGHTYNSSTTYEHLLAVDPDMVMWIGDLCYADTRCGLPQNAAYSNEREHLDASHWQPRECRTGGRPCGDREGNAARCEAIDSCLDR